jgi:hypothetical protein
MPDLSIRYNTDGTARITLVDSETGQQVEGFEWMATVMPDVSGLVVQVQSLDETQATTVATIDSADIVGAREQAMVALIDKAREEGFTVEAAHLGTEQEEPTP